MDGGPNRVPPSRKGRVRCLKCQKHFPSPDRLRVRICNGCKRDPERFGKLGDGAAGVHGVDIPDASDDCQ